MTRLTPIRSLCMLCVISSSLMSSTAKAQSGLSRFDRPFDRPTISPYVNLLRGQDGANVGLNYFGIVRPQRQFDNQNQQLTQQLQTVNRRAQMQGFQSRTQGRQRQSYRIGATGHAASFLSIGGGTAGQTGQAVGQNLQLSGFGNSSGFGATGNSPGFGGDGSSSSFGGSSFGGGGGFGGGGFGGGNSFGGGFNGGGGGGFGGGSFGGGLGGMSGLGGGLGQGF